MSYRITDSSGRTVGYAQDPALELVAAVLMGGALLGLAIVLMPLIAIGYAAYYASGWYMLFWRWAIHLPITPFPNLNGVLVVAAAIFTGWLLVRFARIHLQLAFALGYVFSMALAILVAVIWIIALTLVVGIVVGVVAFAITWLFSIDNIDLFLPIDRALDTLISMGNRIVWFVPLILPIGWICSLVLGLFGKRSIIVTPSNQILEAGFSFVSCALAWWLGMLALSLTGVEDWILLLAGAACGAFVWGLGKGFYKVVLCGQRTFREVTADP